MKFLIVLLLVSSGMQACEICGCSVSNGGLGILPNYQNNFIGLRYRHSPFETIHPDDHTISQEYFHNLELWGRWVPIDRIQVFGSIPFIMNTQNEQNATNEIRELGDASILFNYMLVNTTIDSLKNWKHLLQTGGGVKFPTGRYDLVQNQHTLLPSIQPGSGSFDFMINALYVLRYKNWGINIDANYRINTTNKNEYHIGNKVIFSSRIFNVQNVSNAWTILPHIGIDFEASDPDISYQKEVAYSGYHAVLGNGGADIFYKNLSLGINIQIPLSQVINSGYTTNSYRVSTQLIYFFNSNKNNKTCQI